MRTFWQWLCGYVRISLCGRQVSRFLNLCSKNGIHLWRVSYDLEQNLRACLRLRDFYDIKPYLRKTKTRFKIVSKKGFPFWCYKHPRMKWFFVILFLGICLGLYSFNFIWNIEIKGNYKISEIEIMDCLTQNDITVGKKREDVDCTYIELQLRERFEDLGWVSVYFDHTNLCVELKESLYGELAEQDESTESSYHIISNKEAVISSIITRAGKALVKKGDEVQVGQVLVLGQCEIFDDNGEIKDVLSFPADALIYGDVVYEFSIPLSEIEIMSLKIAGVYDNQNLLRLGYQKMIPIIDKLQENGVIILDKNVIIEKDEKNICFQVKLYVREQIGIKIPAEEVWENEFE